MKKLVALGGGESGVGTAILAKQKGFDVFVSDKGAITKKYKEVLEHYQIDFEENQHTESKIFDANVIMKSPGIPDKAPMILALKQKRFGPRHQHRMGGAAFAAGL